MNLRRIDVLLNEETGERFNKNDVVKITTYSKEWVGRIEWIETSELSLDMSKQYKNYTLKFEFKEIKKIEKV
jgi:hypothetical protein